MKRNYYIAGFTWDGDSQLDRFKEEHIWENGYDEKYEDVYNTMRVGDHIALKSTYVKNSKSYLRIYCMGVIKKIHADNMRVEVDWKDCRKDLTDITWYANTLCKIDNEEHIKRIFNMDNHEETKQDLAELLTTNHNLILTGAPGTGKTYLAKQIAQQLIFGEAKGNLTADEQKRFDEQCGFVQFHPSYDYTDFVEGLRPIQDDNGNVGFERRDGAFKEFCKNALSSGIVQTNNFDDCWDNLIDDIRNNLATDNLTKIGNWEYGLSSKDSLKYNSTTAPSQYSFTITKANVYAAWKGVKARPSGAFQKDMEDVVDYLKQRYKLVDIFLQSTKMGEEKKFVFIIDEINRGEISKIFGELFFSIDPGYRGKKGRVRTQYANMQNTPNGFDDKLGIIDDNNFGHFFVPENVYIIGTMNDIDRSVESMDFAMRRRFAFKEIKASESMKMLDNENAWKDEQDNIVKPSLDVLEKLKNRMTNLNNMIWHEAKTDEKEKCIEGLSSAYHIGAAYFLKLKNYADDADGGFDNLWNNHLEGLLREYLRGSLNIEESIAKLKAAYNNESTENIG